MAAMLTIAILSLAVPVLIFAGYPLLVVTLAALTPPRRPIRSEAPLSSISIVICAYNEAPRIGTKLASVQAALAVWGGKAEILVGDDGSSDGTADVAEQHGARVLRCPRGGKASVLNRIVAMATGDVLVMTDARRVMPLLCPGRVWR